VLELYELDRLELYPTVSTALAPHRVNPIARAAIST